MQTKQALLSKKRETKQEFESHLQQKRTEILTPTFTGQYLRWESFSPLKLPRIRKFACKNSCHGVYGAVLFYSLG